MSNVNVLKNLFLRYLRTTHGKSSSIWKHFNEITEKKRQCKLCGKMMKYCGSSTSFHKHVKKQHRAEYLKTFPLVRNHTNTNAQNVNANNVNAEINAQNVKGMILLFIPICFSKYILHLFCNFNYVDRTE